MSQVRPLKARISNSSGGGVTRVDVYDDIGAGGWFSEGLTAKSFAAQLGDVTGPLEVHINSGGGDVFDGISIKNAIEAHKGNVVTVVDGIAASIASVIAQAGQERVMAPGSMMMIHDAFTVAAGNAAELAKTAATLDEVSQNLAGIYARAAGGTAEQWRDAMRQETWYTAEQAVQAGLATRVGADGGAQLPAGFDVAAYSGIPSGIAAQLQVLPRADIAGAGASHAPFTGTHTHGHAAYGSQGGDETHEHSHSHDGDADHGHGHAKAAAGPGPRAADGSRPFEPAPYSQGDDETVQCPGCQQFNSPDARFCDQCGAKLIGRDDVSPAADGAAASSASVKGTGMRFEFAVPRARVLGEESMPILAKALPVHHTATVDEPWDGPAAVAAMPNDDAVLRYCHAWMSDEAAAETPEPGDDDADDQKGSYKFPHHKTKGGPANLAACRNGLARLEGSKIPDKDRAGVKAHLQAHLDDANKDDEATNHAELPHWLRNQTAAPLPAWLNTDAEEATL